MQVHRGLEEAEGAASVAFGPVERKVGIAQQSVGSQAVARADRDADAGADHGLMAVEVEGLAHQADDLLRERGRLGGVPDGSLHDDEFVASHPRDRVGFADQPAQPVGDYLEKLVTGGMAKRIVHRLELIEIEVMNRDHFLAMNSAAQRMFEPLVQQHAVGQIGQRVVVGHIFDLDLGPALLGDVFVCGDPAAVGHRPMANLEGAAVLQFDDAVGGFVGYRNVAAPVQVFIPRHRGKAACGIAQVDDFGQRRSRTDAVVRKIIHVDVAVVAHDQPMGGVEEA